jgi:hypothetical protein
MLYAGDYSLVADRLYRYSIHDLGAHFPNATGHSDGCDEPMPVEECGNMLVMGASYARHLNDGTTAGRKAAQNWVNKEGRYSLWKQWAGFLIKFGLILAEQRESIDPISRLRGLTSQSQLMILPAYWPIKPTLP